MGGSARAAHVLHAFGNAAIDHTTSAAIPAINTLDHLLFTAIATTGKVWPL